ncbi:hypothetical protein [Flexivirga sp. B27]
MEQTTFSLSGRSDQLHALIDESARRLRLRPVTVDDAAHHKAVVRDEIRQKSSIAQFGSGLRRSLRLLFGRDHPLGRPPVGLDDEIEGIKVSQVEEFIEQNHRPSRLVIAAAGSFDPGAFARACEEKLSVHERSCRPQFDPGMDFAHPENLREDVEEGQRTGLVRATFALPALCADTAIVRLAFALLAQGPMSLLAEEIGADGALGSSAEFVTHAGCPSLGMIRISVGDERRLESAVDAIHASVQRLVAGRVSEDMVTGACRRLVKAQRTELATASGRAAAAAREALWGASADIPQTAGLSEAVVDAVCAAARRYMSHPALVVFHPTEVEEPSWIC